MKKTPARQLIHCPWGVAPAEIPHYYGFVYCMLNWKASELVLASPDRIDKQEMCCTAEKKKETLKWKFVWDTGSIIHSVGFLCCGTQHKTSATICPDFLWSSGFSARPDEACKMSVTLAVCCCGEKFLCDIGLGIVTHTLFTRQSS